MLTLFQCLLLQTGTIAGNLMTKHAHNEFPSDLFLMLETVGAQVVVAKGSTSSDLETTTVAGFLGLDMSKKVICKIILPALNSDSFELKTYKVSDFGFKTIRNTTYNNL